MVSRSSEKSAPGRTELPLIEMGNLWGRKGFRRYHCPRVHLEPQMQNQRMGQRWRMEMQLWELFTWRTQAKMQWNSKDETISSVQPLSRVWLFATPWTATRQASLSITNSWSLLKLMSIELVMPSNHLILCRSLLLLLSILLSIRVFSNESVFRIRWPKYWSYSFSSSPSNEYSGLISLGLTGMISLLSKGLSRVFSNTTVQTHRFFGDQLSLWSNSHTHTWLLEKP